MNQTPRIREHHFNNGAETAPGKVLSSDSPLSHPILEKARDAGLTVVSKIEETVRSRPLTSLGIAAGIGVLVAVWSKRK